MIGPRAAVAQLAEAPDSSPGQCGFESRPPHARRFSLDPPSRFRYDTSMRRIGRIFVAVVVQLVRGEDASPYAQLLLVAGVVWAVTLVVARRRGA